MKKITLMAFVLLPFIGRAQRDICVVNLDIDTIQAKKVYMVYTVEGKSIVDTPRLQNGKAVFRASIPYPLYAQLSLDNRGYGYENGQKPDLLRFYLEKGTISIKTKDYVRSAVITGSKLNAELAEYNRFIAVPINMLEEANYVYITGGEEYRKDSAHQAAFNNAMLNGVARLKELQEQWIKAHPNAYCSLLALSSIAGSNMDVGKVDSLYKLLSVNIRNSVDGKEMGQRIAAAGGTQIGSMAPVFSQNGVDDKPIKLTDFRGKYVLIDFWASWCGPCRAENPNYVKAYNQYKDKNFTLLGVSLDQPEGKNAWLAAIKKDGLQWPQVSDLKYWDNKVAKMYDVRAVPTNYLVDPAGRIVAKNLRGEALQKKLAEIFADSSFTINGYLGGEQQAKKVFLRYNQRVDSTILDNGHFEFKGFVSHPSSAGIWCEEKNEGQQFNNNNVNFYLDAGNVRIISMNSLHDAVLQAGKTEAEQQVLNKAKEPLEKIREDLMNRKYINRDNEDSVLALTKEIARLQQQFTKLDIDFIARFPDSYISYDLVTGYSYAIDPDVLEAMLKALDPAFKAGQEMKDIMHRLDIARLAWIGKPALEFTQADVNGKPVTLKSFRGKYVMIDFWASWCGWCRIEHPYLIKAYNKYNDKGFTILSVSLDDAKDKDKWIAAIKKDGLPWQQVCDLKGRENEVAKLYGIKGIPQSVLVGPDGTIVARNLRGDDLLVKLKELFGK